MINDDLTEFHPLRPIIFQSRPHHTFDFIHDLFVDITCLQLGVYVYGPRLHPLVPTPCDVRRLFDPIGERHNQCQSGTADLATCRVIWGAWLDQDGQNVGQ